MNKRRQTILFFLSLLVISIIISLRLGDSLWLDEAYSVHVASSNFIEIIASLTNDTSPPLYYFLLSLWIKVFGITEYAIRSLSLIFYFIGIIIVYIFSKSFFDKYTGFLCSFLFMVSYQSINQALNGRMYSLLALISILSTIFFLRIFLLKVDSNRELLLYIIVNVLGTFTHYWFMFIIFSQIICYLMIFSKLQFAKFVKAIVISIIPFSLFWLPVLLSTFDNGSTTWFNKPEIFHTLKISLLNFFGGGKKAMIFYTIILVLTVVKIENFNITFRNFAILKKHFSMKKHQSFYILLIFSMLIPLIISQLKPLYAARCMIIALFPFVMIIGSLLSKYGNKFIVLICCYIIVIDLAVNVIVAENGPKRFSDKQTTEYLLRNASNDDFLIFTSLSRVSIDYYLRLIESKKSFIKISFPSETNSHLGWRDVDNLLKNKNILQKEANSIVERILKKTDTKNTKIWLFYGYDTDQSNILKNMLDLHFVLLSDYNLRGSFYNKILVYRIS